MEIYINIHTLMQFYGLVLWSRTHWANVRVNICNSVMTLIKKQQALSSTEVKIIEDYYS